jgi:hypothetical protein
MSQRKRSAVDAQPATRTESVITGRADLRGPRVLDPFACETLAYPRLSPLEVESEPTDEPTLLRPGMDAAAYACEPLDDPTLVRPSIDPREAIGIACEPLEEPTVVYRPWAHEFSRKQSALEAALAKTITRPVLAPMAVTVRAPAPHVVPRPSGVVPARAPAVARSAPSPKRSPAAGTPLVRKCIAGLILTALALMGVRALSKRDRGTSVKTAAAAVSATSRTTTAARGAASARAAVSEDEPRDHDEAPPPIVNGRTAERQAVDLVARGAYGEAAALYDRLARSSDVPAFREAARIAQRKARLSK